MDWDGLEVEEGNPDDNAPPKPLHNDTNTGGGAGDVPKMDGYPA